MKRNNNKFFLLFKNIVAGIILAAMILTLQVFTANNENLQRIEGAGSVPEMDSGYDYVLVIDESGSMKRNDPSGRRVDAAKLFVYLAGAMNPKSRVLVSGFGERTNIYQLLTEINGNEKTISEAINKIQSNQDITDMKDALTVIKAQLDSRQEKKKTIVIFLTDGALTIDDIPAQGQGIEKPSREQTSETASPDGPGRPVKDQEAGQNSNLDTVKAQGSIDFADALKSNSKEDQYLAEVEIKDTVSSKDYLENYKKELIDLCYAYRNGGIVIYPIAFTQEADVSLLEQMANITKGICWKAKEAKDIRISFIEILKNITSRFIKIEEQVDSTDLSSTVPVASYIKDLIVIGLENNFNSPAQIMLTTPSGNPAEYDDYIEESLFKIARVISPQEGDWKYKIKGDAIFVYDIAETFISGPGYPVYTSDAPLLLKLDMLKNDSGTLDRSSGDFEVTANILDPGGALFADAELNDDGSTADIKAGDGIFTGNFEAQDIKGYYTFNFLANHIPTGSVASKSISIEFVELPGKITAVEPSADNYNINKPVIIEVKLDKDEAVKKDFDPLNYKLAFSLTDPSGQTATDLVLLDNGQGADKTKGDGVYSAVLENKTIEGFYEIEFFIRDASFMTAPACTAIKAGFNLSKAPDLNILVENNLFVTGNTIIRANFEDKSLSEFKYFITAPDGTESSGIMEDNGNAGNGDLKAADGIASSIIEGPGLAGEYNLKVQAEYRTESGKVVPVFSETVFAKELSISKPETVRFEENSGFGQATFKVTSQSASAKQLTVDLKKFDKGQSDNNIVKSVKINGNKTVSAGKESSIVLAIELEDKVKMGGYKVIIPIAVDDNSFEDVIFEVSVPQSAAPYLLWILIGGVVLAVAIIVLFIYFLYIRPKKRGY